MTIIFVGDHDTVSGCVDRAIC